MSTEVPELSAQEVEGKHFGVGKTIRNYSQLIQYSGID